MSERMGELIASPRVAPSILSADFSRLGSQLDEVMDAGARVIHFDVMDGHFVPPITIGPLVSSSIADRVHAAGGAVDVHLMIERPERQIEAFAEAGADSITFHEEATPHAQPDPRRDPRARLPRRHRDQSRHPGRGSGRAARPRRHRPLHDRQPRLGRPVLHPELARQGLPPQADWLGDARIEVDGGIDASTAGPVAEAGASLFVAGSAVFGADDPAAAYSQISEAVARG